MRVQLQGYIYPFFWRIRPVNCSYLCTWSCSEIDLYRDHTFTKSDQLVQQNYEKTWWFHVCFEISQKIIWLWYPTEQNYLALILSQKNYLAFIWTQKKYLTPNKIQSPPPPGYQMGRPLSQCGAHYKLSYNISSGNNRYHLGNIGYYHTIYHLLDNRHNHTIYHLLNNRQYL